MSFMAYELAVNPDVQEKLFQEIQAMNDELDGKTITYEKIQVLKYMDQVVCETLRKWPAAPVRTFVVQRFSRLLKSTRFSLPIESLSKLTILISRVKSSPLRRT